MSGQPMRRPATGTDPGRRARLAKVHIGKTALGLEDDAYRDLLERETGRRSAADLDNARLDRVIEAMARLGFKPASKGVRPSVDGRSNGGSSNGGSSNGGSSNGGSSNGGSSKPAPGVRRRTPSSGARHGQARKARSLWLSLHHLGEVRDPSESAMDRFVARQCGISSAAWMREPSDAARVIEALKSWCGRAGAAFDKWEMARAIPAVKRPRLAVIEAQLMKLGDPPADAWSLGGCSTGELDAHIGRLGERIRARTPTPADGGGS